FDEEDEVGGVDEEEEVEWFKDDEVMKLQGHGRFS
ncbi:hypothetical protein A2U01_0103197, partial [Trifolium medium]|nr:hypothetical protein [Trifolium medium]